MPNLKITCSSEPRGRGGNTSDYDPSRQLCHIHSFITQLKFFIYAQEQACIGRLYFHNIDYIIDLIIQTEKKISSK